MVVLKQKIQASTLMETLVATVLIVVVFMVASMVLNNLFASSFARNDQLVRQELMELQYQYEHGKLELPHYSELGSWKIEVIQQTWKGQLETVFVATHELAEREVVFKYFK